MAGHKAFEPTIIILDSVSDRCLREEAALDKAIEEKDIYACGMSNYGQSYIARSGVPQEKLPCIEIETLYFYPPRPNEELTYEMLCRFLDMMVAEKILRRRKAVQAELD